MRAGQPLRPNGVRGEHCRFLSGAASGGAIRQDIDAAVILHIVEMLSYGQLTIGDFKPLDQFPPYDAVMEAPADIMDRALRPEDGGTSEAGKAICRQIAAARVQMERLKQAQDMKQAIRQGANHDNG